MANRKANKIRKSLRYQAMEILDSIDTKGAYSNLELSTIINKDKLSDKDAALLTEIVYGTLQHKLTLDYGLSDFIRTPKKLESWVRNLLRLSAYQMVYLSRIPDHAILYDAVEIAKSKGHSGIAKLVNVILRNVQRNGLKDYQEIKDPLEKISIGASLPLWIVKLFHEQIGLEKTEKLAYSLLEKPYLAVRVQPNRTDREKAQAILEEEGIVAELSPLSPLGLRIVEGHVTESRLFSYGMLTIQDESSQLVALMGELQPEAHVLDACAAPGGKTTHMAAYLDPALGGKVEALDIYEHKMKLIEQNATRMGLTDVIETHQLDAKDAGTKFALETFDTIYVDAPCSGLGLMRRKPDIKYNVTPDMLASLHQEQLAILAATAPLLKSGGRLVYSTCTLAEEENQQTVGAFLDEHRDFQVVPAHKILNKYANSWEQVMTQEGYVQIYPDDFQTDGFFICVLEKK